MANTKDTFQGRKSIQVVIPAHTASFRNIIIQWTSLDDLTDFFLNFTETAREMTKIKTALCDLKKTASVEFCQPLNQSGGQTHGWILLKINLYYISF